MEKIDFNTNRNLAEIITDTVQFIKHEGKSLFKFYLVFVLPLFIPIAILTYQSDLFILGEAINEDIKNIESMMPNLNMKGIIIVALAQALAWIVFLATSLVYIRNYNTPNSEPLSTKEMWNQMFYEFPRLFIVQFFYFSLVFFGLVSFILPGIYFGVSLALTATIAVFEDARIFQAFSKSMRLVRTKWLQCLGYLIVLYLIYIGAGMLLQIPVKYIGTSLQKAGELTNKSYAIIASTTAFINTVASIFPVLGSVFIYASLNAKFKANSKIN